MKRIRSRIVLGLAGLGVAVIGGFATISCGGDDDTEPVASPTAKATTAVTPETTPTPVATPTRAAPKLGEAQVGSISISGASVRETTNDVTAMYMTIKTTGAGDRLISATTPISPMVQLHESVMVNGAMKMQEVAGGIALPATGEVVLKTGGLHVMLMNLKAPLKAEQTVTFELTFEKAGKVTLVAPVKPISDTTGTSGMGTATPMATNAH